MRKHWGGSAIGTVRKAASAAKWSGVSVVVTSASQFLVLAVLARILDKEAFGLASIVYLFYTFVDVFVGLGLTSALIQRRQVTSRELASVHWANIGIVVFAFGVIAALSGPITTLMNWPPAAQPLIVVSAFALAVTAPGQASRAVLEKRLEFRPLGIADSAFGILSFVVAVGLALLGFGAMSAAIGLVVGAAARTLVFVLSARRLARFRWHFRLADTRRFFAFGVWQALDGILNYVSNTLATFATGRFVSVAALGGFNSAYTIGVNIPSRLGPTITRVLFPYFSLIQHDRKRIEQDYLRMLTLFGVTTGPLLAGIAAASTDVMTLAFGPKFTSFGPVLAILCIAGWVRALGYPVGSLLAATDNLRLGVYLNIARTVVNIPLILVMAFFWGVEGAAWSLVVMGVVSYFLGYWCLWKVTGATFGAYFRATVPAFTLAILPVLGVLGTGWLLAGAPLLVRLIVQVVVAILALVLSAILSRDPSVRYFTGIVRTLVSRKRCPAVAVILPVTERYDGTGGAVASWTRNTYSQMPEDVDYAIFCPAGGGDYAGPTHRTRMPLYDGADAVLRALARIAGRITGKNPNGIMRVLSVGGRFWIWSLYPWVAGSAIIHLHNEPSYAVALRRMGYRGKIVLHMHNDAVQPVRNLTGGRRPRTTVAALEEDVDAWLFCSGYLAEDARRELALRGSLGVIHNGATSPDAKPSFHAPHHPVRLAYAGRLIEDKGVVEAVLAAGALATRMPVTMDIFGGKATGMSSGESPYTRRVRAAADEVNAAHPDSQVRIRGFVSPEVLAAELADSDVFVYPCRWEEPFGMVLLDAMNVGTPVVAAQRGGIPEIVTGDSGGSLVPPDATAEQIAGAIEGLVADPRYPQRREEAYRVASERFSWSQICARLREVLEKL